VVTLLIPLAGSSTAWAATSGTHPSRHINGSSHHIRLPVARRFPE
jgi:hypothetical protein